jgi:hypothetical protein
MKIKMSLLTISTLLSALLVMGGCATGEKLLPKIDEVLIYPLPFDLTYLRTVEALEQHPDWELEETEKEKGVITVRNTAYGQFGDADKRHIVFDLRRISGEKTSVSIAPRYQQVLGGGELLKLIAKYLTNEL